MSMFYNRVLRGMFRLKRRSKRGILENFINRFFILCTSPLSVAGTFTFTK
jgi:hypothetical protein